MPKLMTTCFLIDPHAVVKLDHATNMAYTNMVAADAAISTFMSLNPDPNAMASQLISLQVSGRVMP